MINSALIIHSKFCSTLDGVGRGTRINATCLVKFLASHQTNGNSTRVRVLCNIIIVQCEYQTRGILSDRSPGVIHFLNTNAIQALQFPLYMTCNNIFIYNKS